MSWEDECSSLTDVHHEVIVVRHYSKRADVDRKDRCQLRHSLEHPFLAVRIVAPRVLVIAPQPCAANATGNDVIVGSVVERDERLASVGRGTSCAAFPYGYIYSPARVTRVSKYLGDQLEISACPRVPIGFCVMARRNHSR